jgi:hypothetical protein
MAIRKIISEETYAEIGNIDGSNYSTKMSDFDLSGYLCRVFVQDGEFVSVCCY